MNLSLLFVLVVAEIVGGFLFGIALAHESYALMFFALVVACAAGGNFARECVRWYDAERRAERGQ